MKVKEIDRTANIAWSPAAHHPIYLAAGTAAQQLDATFSTTAILEIYALNLTEPGLDMCMKGSVISDFRFHKVVWGCEGMKSSEESSGVLVGGADGGNIMIYDAAKLIRGDSPLTFQVAKHTGPVHSLDFNKFQDCLLASGATESEIFIWDLNNPTAPVTLGAKSQPLEDVTCVAWNNQVQHILASTFPARCIVWDLRKNEPIIKVSDSSARLRCKVVAWHPEVATQLCIASEDDHSPVIQLWDLRFATSPLKTLEHHTRGVLSIAWCPHDPDLLLSCGKDNRILCWNPNSNVENGEVLCELPAGSQWSFDVAWCPRNPAIIANSSCDGHVGVFSLMGGQQQVQCSSKIAESFPGSDSILQPPLMESMHRHVSVPLQKPPKWLRRPVGASFGFGGKLVSFMSEANVQSQPDVIPSRHVHIHQVVTEPDLLLKSEKLESALANSNMAEYCQSKVDACQSEQDRITWSFLQATFYSAPRAKMLSLLEYDYAQVVSEINNALKDKKGLLDQIDLVDQVASISMADELQTSDGSAAAFDSIAMSEKEKVEVEPISIRADPGDVDGLISRALLTGNLPSAVEVCVNEGRWADALVLAQAGGPQLLYKAQRLYFKACRSGASKLISAVVTSDWAHLIQNCDLACWREMLAAILTYAKPEDFASLCEMLGSRLESDPQLHQNAALCYISAGNLERLASAWAKVNKSHNIHSLQCLIEQVMVLRSAVEQLSGSSPPLQTGILSSLLGQYAEALATQGSLNSAVTYLVDPNERTLSILRDRIYQALGHQSPHFPFQKVDVRRSSSVSSVSSAHHPLEHTQAQRTSYSHSIPQHNSVSSAQHTQARKLSYPHSVQQQPYGNTASAVSSSFGYSTSAPNSQYQSTSTPISQYQPAQVPTSQYQSAHVQTSQYQPAHVPTSQYQPAPVPTSQYQPASVPVSQYQPTPAPAPAPVPPPSDSIQHSVKSSSHSMLHRYPRHLHDPSVYSETSGYPNQQSYYQPQDMLASRQMPNPAPGFYPSPAPNYNSTVAPYPPVASSVPPVSQSPAPYTQFVPAPVSQVPAPLPSCYNDVKPGWNDPPPLKQSSNKTTPISYETLQPITSPFPDVPAPAPAPSMPGNYFAPSYPAQQQTPAMMPNPLPHNPVIEETPQIPKVPDQPKEKEPIPPEHQILQDIFEDLRKQCQQVATNPQTKRKLDDVAKKLENLYDKLRDNSLSSQVLLGLHQMVQAIMQSDYGRSLAVHAQLVQSVNFSEIGGFMPSIKVLLQTSIQLNVSLS